VLLKLLLIFLAGLISDLLVTRYTRAVSEKRPLLAASLSTASTVCNLTFVSLILAWTENSGIAPIAAFAGGSWLGTYVTLRQA